MLIHVKKWGSKHNVFIGLEQVVQAYNPGSNPPAIRFEMADGKLVDAELTEQELLALLAGSK